MKIIVIALILSVLLCVISLPYMLRAFARSRSDQMIYGTRPGTKKLINRCISILTWSNKWQTFDEEPDNLRIFRLYDLLKKIQNPHG